MNSSAVSFVDSFLSALEVEESRLLSWGFYDAVFDASDATRILDKSDGELFNAWMDLSNEQGLSIPALLREMDLAGLLYRVDQDPPRYRTRFAEGVRLIARLRQMFDYRQWATGANLVSDIKIHLSPRRYPKRDRDASQCWEALKAHCRSPQVQRDVFDALTHDRTGQYKFRFAGFQERAFERILSEYGTGRTASGTIVCAGTGSGKTKAFYVPAFVGMAGELASAPYTKIIAIYPRNVLLADQLREAIAEASKLTPVLERHGLRPFRFGALLGNTPWARAFEEPGGTNGVRAVVKWHGWKQRGRDFLTPLLKSPLNPGEELVWRNDDRQAGRTGLYGASGGDTPHVADGVLALTRDELLKKPVDVLFVSAEMLNRELSNPEWSGVFGTGRGRSSPRLLLLDEVHAYDGITGAHMAWILRRWRNQLSHEAPLHVVGLSATLRDAQRHLSKVASVRQSEVQECGPRGDEFEQEGIEYNLAVKGDPAAGASLLSTSIQTGMILSRLLTPRTRDPSPATALLRPEDLFGRKVFGFTDNLDGVNRWFSDMVDAERNRRLARLRLRPRDRVPPPQPPPTSEEERQMDREGQIWDLPRRLGFNLEQPLLLARCSSQDPGADANADVIIATSSLEVGFDDPLVGAVLQHKRPISASSFLQRKGRAGRTRGTRPWTVVVLSDYGADRWTFQESEHLFDPELEPLRIPLRNPHVLRVQATYFLIDWIGHRIGQGAAFDYLRRPNAYTSRQRARAIKILLDFLDGGPEWERFHRDLTRLIRDPTQFGKQNLEDEVDSILWEEPRPLLRHVVPTLLRKLEVEWRVAENANSVEDVGRTYPLPGYLPKATFSSIDLNEVDVSLNRGQPLLDQEAVSVSHALFDSCPGRVSKRYATRVGEPGFWHSSSTSLKNVETRLELQSVYPDSFERDVIDGVRVLQPLAVTLEHRTQDVLDSSFASWNWKSRLRPIGPGCRLPLFVGAQWRDVVIEVESYLHRDQSGIDVLRYAPSCRYEIRHSNRAGAQQSPVRGTLLLGRQGYGEAFQPQAVGFGKQVDGLRLRLAAGHFAAPPSLTDDQLARFRSDYFLDVLLDDEWLSEKVNPFLVRWSWQISLAMLAATALRNRCDLQEAQSALQGRRSQSAERVLSHVLGAHDVLNGDPDGRLIQNLRELWSDAAVVARIEALEAVLWDPPDSRFADWLRRRYAATWAQALRTTITTGQTDVSDEDVEVDVQQGLDGEVHVYLTETQSGGLGQIETLVRSAVDDPNVFEERFRRVLEICPRDRSTRRLLAIAQHAAIADPTDELSTAIAQVRSARGFADMQRANEALRRGLEDAGFPPARATVVSVMNKLLRGGSSPATDRAHHVLNRLWRRAERRLGIGIDSRVFAYCALQRLAIRSRLAQHFEALAPEIVADTSQQHATLAQFLLLDCRDSCSECLDHPNRFNRYGTPSRDLAVVWLGTRTPEFASAEVHDWLTEIRVRLAAAPVVGMWVDPDDLAEVGRRIPSLLARPIEVGFLLLPVALSSVEQIGSRWRLSFRVRGAVHG